MVIDTIKGESTDAGFAGAIHVSSWNWGMTQSGNTHTSTGSGMGKVSVGDLSFVKAVDSTSPTLTQACCNGTAFKTATLSMRKAGGTALVYLVITLKNVIISSVQLGSSSSDETQMETITFNFGEFSYEYTSQASAGTAGATTSVTWNIPGNSPNLS
ncbi:MAG TPA: type VI secretion system tube protein Hcp [Polyangia bacterium]|nr:type VI secretion system tube protein Hcp [Polyangia bacterium]